MILLEGFFQLFTDPVQLIQYGGIILLLAIIYMETGFFLGFIIPGGDYLIFTAGLLSVTNFLNVPLLVLVPAMIVAAILGDFTGYLQGRWLGKKLYDKPDSKLFKRSYLQKSRAFYDKYGMWAFVTGRFLPVIRTMIPMLAGASGISFRRFSYLNIIGAVLWIGTLAPLGYFLGDAYPQLIHYSIYFLIGFMVVASSSMLRIIKPFQKKKKH